MPENILLVKKTHGIMSLFENKKALIITKHGKQKVIAPPLERHLHLPSSVFEIDTDKLGTFSKEIPRTMSPRDCAKAKCKIAYDTFEHISKQSFCFISSEGSFGSHPDYPMLRCNTEILYFWDPTHDFELFIQDTTLSTNLDHGVFDNLDDFLKVTQSWQFPSHSVILEPHKPKEECFFKGIHDHQTLLSAFEKAQNGSLDGRVFIQTDMRADQNPTRMAFIGELAEKMALRLSQNCPACQSPGWGSLSFNGQLPCQVCFLETSLSAYETLSCERCGYSLSKPRSDGLIKADPSYCYSCNP